MISDTLLEAIEEIQAYLDDPVTADVYREPTLRAEINNVLAVMGALRERLDRVPDVYRKS